MSEILRPKVLVVGGGPGGYVAALRADQLGLDTMIVEADRLGGTCLIRGCIPSKALIHAASHYEQMVSTHREACFGISLSAAPVLDFAETTSWKDGIVDRLGGGVVSLLDRAKVRRITGWARFTDAKTCSVETAEGPVRIAAEHVILATGSVPAELPFMPFGGKVISSTEALMLDHLPERLVVVGAGYIGLELGIAFAKLGAAVSIVEAADSILPQFDTRLSDPVKNWLLRHGVALHLGAKALGVTNGGLEIETAESAHSEISADRILVAVGRKPATNSWGLENMALAMNGHFVRVDERCATSTTNVWAIGDLVGEPMLAHKASAQGEMVAEIIAGKRRRFDPVAVPAICFTEPEIVSVGIAQPADGHAVGLFPFHANGRALSIDSDNTVGFVRTIADTTSSRILGIQAVGRHVSELSGEFVTLLEMGATLGDVAGIIHAHPTLGEAVKESALQALGRALHI